MRSKSEGTGGVMNEGGKFSRSALVVFAIALLFVAGAVASYVRGQRLRADADWLMARGNAEAIEYANSLDQTHHQRQLQTFDERRAVLEKAERFRTLQLFCTLAAVLCAFASYVLYLYWRLRQQLLDATGDGSGPHAPVAAMLRSP